MVHAVSDFTGFVEIWSCLPLCTELRLAQEFLNLLSPRRGASIRPLILVFVSLSLSTLKGCSYH
jgi:hypothetical protein